MVGFAARIPDVHCADEVCSGDIGDVFFAFLHIPKVDVSQSLGTVADLEDKDTPQTQAAVAIEEHGDFLSAEKFFHPREVILPQEAEIPCEDHERE